MAFFSPITVITCLLSSNLIIFSSSTISILHINWIYTHLNTTLTNGLISFYHQQMLWSTLKLNTSKRNQWALIEIALFCRHQYVLCLVVRSSTAVYLAWETPYTVFTEINKQSNAAPHFDWAQMKHASWALLLALTCAGSFVVMEKVSLSACAVISTDIIVAKMITHSLPIYLGQTLINVC